MSEENDSVTAINTTPFINRSKVKKFAIQFAQQQIRTKNHSRVSVSFLERINDRVRNMIIDEVKRQPTVGKTLT